MEEPQKQSVSLGEIRNVPETINASIDFLRFHGRKLRKLVLNRALPVLLFAKLIYLFIIFNSSPPEAVAGQSSYVLPWFFKFLLFGIFYSVGWALLVGIVYSYLRLAETHEVEDFSEQDVWQGAKASFWRVFGTNIGLAFLAFLGLMIISAVMRGIPVVGTFLYLFSFLFFLTIWSLYYPARFIDDYGFFESFGRSQRLVQGRFWKTSGFVMTLGLLSVALLGIFISFYGYLTLLGIPGVGFGNPLWVAQHPMLMKVLFSFAFILLSTASDLVYVLPMISLVVYYRSQEERQDSTMLKREIGNITRVEPEEGGNEEKTKNEMAAAGETSVVEGKELESSLSDENEIDIYTEDESGSSGGVGNIEMEDDERG